MSIDPHPEHNSALTEKQQQQHADFNSGFDQSRAETDAPEFHVRMTPPQNGVDVKKEDWAEYERRGGRMQAQNTVHNSKMPVTRKQLVERLGTVLGWTEAEQRNGNMLRYNLHQATELRRTLKLSRLIEITGQLDTDNFCFDLAEGPGRVIAVISAQANAFRKHVLVSTSTCFRNAFACARGRCLRPLCAS